MDRRGLDPYRVHGYEASVKPRVDRIAADMERAKENFTHHVIRKESEGRWLLSRPGSQGYWFETVVLAGGYLLVHGDIQAILFGGYHSDNINVPESNLGCIRWMAKRSRPDDPYFLEKAKLGTGTDALLWEEDDDVLREEIEDLIQETKASDVEYPREDTPRVLEALEEALGEIGGDSTHAEIQKAIYEAIDDGERVPRGRKITMSMVFAHAALQKLYSLLLEREGLRFCPVCGDNVRTDEKGNCPGPWCGETYDARWPSPKRKA